MKRIKIIGSLSALLVIVSVLTYGCATVPSTPFDSRMVGHSVSFDVKVSSLTAFDAPSKGKVYFIASAVQNIDINDLQFQEFAKYVENALSQKGYIRTEDQKKADTLIRMAYGIGEPQITTSTYTTSSGYSYPVGWMWFNVPPQSRTIQQTTYTRTLVLEAYDLKNPDRKGQLWKTTIKSEGGMSDLRIVLAYMIAASVDYIATNTGKQVDVKIRGNDARVLNIWK